MLMLLLPASSPTSELPIGQRAILLHARIHLNAQQAAKQIKKRTTCSFFVFSAHALLHHHLCLVHVVAVSSTRFMLTYDLEVEAGEGT
jgi:hypothetical protein